MNLDNIIRLAGYRVTSQRRMFMDILEKERCIENELLKDTFIKNSHANLTTFYRVLEDFKTCGFVHCIKEDGRDLVYLCDEVRKNKIPSNSYELLHCHTCGKLQDSHDSEISENMLSSHREIHVEKCGLCDGST